ncbi:MAG: extracellular solute-binding protein [Pseudomonadota bacterium]
MTIHPLPRLRGLLAAAVVASTALPSLAEPRHGIAMYGEPALPPDFVSLPYANPDAPKGGRVVLAEVGTFDSLNPYTLKGTAPWGLGLHTVETLMARSIDEPFTLYGLLAESVETDPARSWVEFTLREGARFSDQSPVTVEDVIWSFETLGTKGAPRYRGAWAKVAGIAQTGPRSLRITFKVPDRELPLLMGLRPVLKKAQYAGRDFAEVADEAPIGSGAYVVDRVDPGRSIRFRRNPDWWGKDLPVNRGQQNLDEIRYDYFGDATVAFEAFKAGEVTVWREANPVRWATSFAFPAVTSGAVVREEIAHRRPSGIIGLVMNTRKPQLADWRVREALILAFNFPFINQALNGGTEPRITSYFANSDLAAGDGPAEGAVADLLAPFAASLPPGALDGYTLPEGSPDELNRRDMRKAVALLEEAGWSAEGGTLHDAAGAPFRLEILLPQGSAEVQAMVDIYTEALKRLGITPTVTVADPAQYRQRQDSYDFDMTWIVRALSLSPGNEQKLYWGAAGVTEPGSRNLMGMNVPAAEALIDRMLNADDPTDFTAAAKALDRVLTAGRYVVPVWFARVSRIAHDAHLHHPDRIPLYGDWPGFLPEVWWYEN